jgi:hypothetical protein
MTFPLTPSSVREEKEEKSLTKPRRRLGRRSNTAPRKVFKENFRVKYLNFIRVQQQQQLDLLKVFDKQWRSVIVRVDLSFFKF